MKTAPLSPFQIERDGVRIEIINNDPDGLPSYRRAFIFQGEGEVSIRHAWDIARFLTKHSLRAARLLAYRRLRQKAGLSTRPKDRG